MKKTEIETRKDQRKKIRKRSLKFFAIENKRKKYIFNLKMNF